MFVGKRMAAGATVATMIGAAGLAATAPANAAAVDGQTVVTFNKATWKALDKGGIMVEGVGKAEPINVRSFGFPAKQSKPRFIRHKGGIAFVRADASLTLTKFRFDLQDENVDVTVPGLGVVKDALDLGNLKIGKKAIRARLNVAFGQADTLNAALKTTIFKDGMTLGRSKTTFEG